MAADFLTTYINATETERVDLIFDNYHAFPGILSGCLREIIFFVNEEIDCKHRAQSIAGLGVQTYSLSDKTSKEAIRNVSIEEAIIECKFDNGVLDDTEHKIAFMNRAFDLKKMRRDYETLSGTIGDVLNEEERELLLSFLLRTKRVSEMAESENVGKEAIYMRIQRVKTKITDKVSKEYTKKVDWLT